MNAITYFIYALGMWYGGKLIYDDEGDVLKEYYIIIFLSVI